MVVALQSIDHIKILGSNPIVSKGEQNTNVGFILSHEKTTNIPSTTLSSSKVPWTEDDICLFKYMLESPKIKEHIKP